MEKKPRKTDDARLVQRGSLALSIPTLLLAGPITGLLLSYLAIRLLHLEGDQAKWTKVVLMLLGLAAGGRETLKVIRRISEDG